MSDRDGDLSWLSANRPAWPRARLEWALALFGLGAAALMFATTLPGRALLHVGEERVALLRSLAGAYLCACFVLLSLRQKERSGADARLERKVLPFILLANLAATLLIAATLLLDALLA